MSDASTLADNCPGRYCIEGPTIFGLPKGELPFVIGIVGDFGTGVGEKSFEAPTAAHLRSRGLSWLMQSCATCPSVQLKTLHASKEEIGQDLLNPGGVKHSFLYSRIGEPTESWGGDPFSVIVVDYEFSPDPQDIKILSALARIGDEFHVTMITSGTLEFVPATAPGNSDPSEACAKHYDQRHFEAWRKLRKEQSSNFLYLTVPTVTVQIKPDCRDGASMDPFAQMNSSYCVASRLALAHHTYGWTATISPAIDPAMMLCARASLRQKGPEVERLPPLRWAEALSNSGFLPLIGRRGSDSAAIFNCRSVFKGDQHHNQLLSVVLVGRIVFHILETKRKFATEDQEFILEVIRRWLKAQCVSNGDTCSAKPGWSPFRLANIEPVGTNVILKLTANLPSERDIYRHLKSPPSADCNRALPWIEKVKKKGKGASSGEGATDFDV